MWYLDVDVFEVFSFDLYDVHCKSINMELAPHLHPV